MAAFDPYDPEQFARLRKAVRTNYKALDPFRRVRKLVAHAERGHHYKNTATTLTSVRDTVNPLNQWVQVLVSSLVQSIPRARITSRSNPKVARIFEAHMNETVVEIDVLNTLRRLVKESLLGYLGVAHCGIAPTERDPVGEAFVDSIPLPNLVMDISHDEYDQADLVGHRFSRRIVELQESGMYDSELVDKLVSREHANIEMREHDDRDPGQFDDATLFDWADIWAIKIKPANLIVYYADNDRIDRPLRVESFDGPDFGPYVFLGYDRVLDEMMPNSPGAKVLDMHDFVVGQYMRIFMKEDQAAEVWTYEGSAEEDARRIKHAFDGEFVRVDNINAVQRILKGGTNPQSLGTAMHARHLFDEFTGNVRRSGGVAASADTATEARIDSANTSRLIRDMQLQVIAATKKIYQIIAWYEWTHPKRRRQVEVKIGENGRAVTELWSPEIRDGDFVQFEIDVEPDSFEHRSSRQQLEELMKAVQGIVIPLTQMPMSRPIRIKGPELLDEYSKLANLPQLERIADYAPDDSFVSQPSGGGGSRVPAGATSGGKQSGGARIADPEAQFVERAIAGATGGGGQEDQI